MSGTKIKGASQPSPDNAPGTRRIPTLTDVNIGDSLAKRFPSMTICMSSHGNYQICEKDRILGTLRCLNDVDNWLGGFESALSLGERSETGPEASETRPTGEQFAAWGVCDDWLTKWMKSDGMTVLVALLDGVDSSLMTHDVYDDFVSGAQRAATGRERPKSIDGYLPRRAMIAGYNAMMKELEGSDMHECAR